MYKIISVLLVFVAFGQAENRVLRVSHGKIIKMKDYPVITVETEGSTSNITWNKDVTANENPLRATYKFIYISQNITKRASSSNLCKLAEKGSFTEVCQTYFLNVLANTHSCPIKKGTKVHYSAPFTYNYSINKSGGCGKYKAVFKLFEKSEKSNKNPGLIQITKGTITGC